MRGSELQSYRALYHIRIGRGYYTPKHGSWLNQAQIEISLFARQCLGGRTIPNLAALHREAQGWNRRMDRARKKINWKFDRRAARIKFGYKKAAGCAAATDESGTRTLDPSVPEFEKTTRDASLNVYDLVPSVSSKKEDTSAAVLKYGVG
jgi:hypothetical protein